MYLVSSIVSCICVLDSSNGAIDILNRRPKGAAAGETLSNGKNRQVSTLEKSRF